ncbi:conserved hypothetical protein [Ricinus communis]|uniref:CRM domain-containing protein n=1 Tax=Ricinus communis TaxID=3988 RepID=B9S664_RICCO|nr:conserved hypothetical protein [Ricinus communis]|eukprot:XP_002521483.1 uncharacterized protein LOC8279093 [Ricinus communis]
MFAARRFHSHCFKTLSSLLLSNPNRNAMLVKDVTSTKLACINLMQQNVSCEYGFPSFLPLDHPFNNGSCRGMSTSKGRSMRSKVERRMQKESGKTLREIRRAKKLKKKLMTDEERLIYNLKRAKKKVALLLQKLKKYELPELPPPLHDPELFTSEQLQAYKKIGFRNRNYVPVGVRGVFGGVVQNMHLHWKFHETVQVCCDNFPKEKIKEMATMLARLSGGIVINIHNVKTIIMFRGRNYRQPKNLIPINTLTKRKALFKARFEQALESQKLNIKKIEQQLRRMGVNPEDPVAMASIQRVASTFFNAIDKKEGSPYVFQGDKQPVAQPIDDMEHPEPAADSDQEELDRFIAEIEDAADKEWAAEEAAEQEEFGKIRYWNKEDFGGRVRRSEMHRSAASEGEERGAGRWKDAHDRRRNDDRDDDNDDGQWDSDDVEISNDLESETDDSDEVLGVENRSRGVHTKQNGVGRDYNTKGFRRNAEAKFQREVVKEDSKSEYMLSDLDSAASDGEERGARRWKDAHNRRRNDDQDDDGQWDSDDVEIYNDLESETDDSDEVLGVQNRSRGVHRKQNGVGRDYNTKGFRTNAEAKFQREVVKEDSKSEHMLSDLDSAMWESNSEEEESRAEASHSFSTEGHKLEKMSSYLDNQTWESNPEQEYDVRAANAEDPSRRKTTRDDLGSENVFNDSEVAVCESDIDEDFGAGGKEEYDYGAGGETEDYRKKQYEMHQVYQKKKTPKKIDEDWDSD